MAHEFSISDNAELERRLSESELRIAELYQLLAQQAGAVTSAEALARQCMEFAIHIYPVVKDLCLTTETQARQAEAITMLSTLAERTQVTLKAHKTQLEKLNGATTLRLPQLVH